MSLPSLLLPSIPRALAYAIAQAITGDLMMQTIKIALGAASFHLWLSVSRYIL
jgi:hypothetical protein